MGYFCMKKLYFFLVFSFIVFLVFFYYKKNSNDQKREPNNELVVGISADFPPFSSIDEGIYVGFDIDLTMLIAKELKKDVTFKNMPFLSLLSALQLKQITMVIASLTPTPERCQKVLFSENYIDSDSFVILSLAKNKKESLPDLVGKKIIVNTGYSAEKYVDSLQADYGFTIQKLKTLSDALFALKNGIADAFVTAESTVTRLFETELRDVFCVAKIPGTIESSAIAFHKDQQELCGIVNNILKKFKENGTIAFLKKKWNIAV